ncbi:hypothetical protein D3C80_1539500 [compost metagenome]
MHRHLPQTSGCRQWIAGIGVVHQLRIEPGLLAQCRAVEAQGVELLAQGAGPAGEGGGFNHDDWRFRSTGWRSQLTPGASAQGRMRASITKGWKHVRYFCKSPGPECTATIGAYPPSGARTRRRTTPALPAAQSSGCPWRGHSGLRPGRDDRFGDVVHDGAHGLVGMPAAECFFCVADP